MDELELIQKAFPFLEKELISDIDETSVFLRTLGRSEPSALNNRKKKVFRIRSLYLPLVIAFLLCDSL